MTGAEAVVGTLAECGVTACFANPGTSEMHLVTALDREPRIRSVLCLFEGVATGAADGFARMTGSPAMTLLHLGPGFMNGGANIHNARRAHSPMVNVIGDHAVSHRGVDAPLASDIAGIAGPNSRWVRSAEKSQDAGRRAVEAFLASLGPPPGPVSLILPADSAWSRGGQMFRLEERPSLRLVDQGLIEEAARAVRSARKPVLLINGSALTPRGLEAAARLDATGVKVYCDTFVGRQARGAGRFAPARMPYFAEAAIEEMTGVDLMLVAGSRPPVAFFAYPGAPSLLSPPGCRVFMLGGSESDSADTLHRMGALLDARNSPHVSDIRVAERPTGRLTPSSVGASLARHMPEGAIISDDGVTAGLPCMSATVNAAPHDWLGLTGGAIGQGMPLAVGASIARPASKTICLTGDGAGMYTVQALWTMAREKLDVVTIVFVNNSYRILKIELQRTGAGNPGPAASGMLSLADPEIDWVKLAEGMGVEAQAVSTAEAFDDALMRALSHRGPRLIAAVMPG
ncbi:acetolactate synthase large subunit [bacterium]|nr:acetolactate synthase large subunit [bacterium]